MDYIRPRDIFWCSVKLNPSIKTDPPLTCPKNVSILSAEYQRIKLHQSSGQLKDLLNLSAEKLVSDVSLLRHKICYLPDKICSILLLKAICSGRILSVIELMRYCPHEELIIPTPSILKKYYVNNIELINDEVKKHYSVVVTILSTFLSDIVRQNCRSSRLKSLDLGSTPVCCEWLTSCLEDFIEAHQVKYMKSSKSSNYRKLNPKNIKSVKEIGEKTSRNVEKVLNALNPSHEYVLKCCIRVEENHNLEEVKECFAKLKSTNLKVIFSGVLFCNVFCPLKQVQDLMENVNQDSKLLSIVFSDFRPRLQSLLTLLDKFKYLQCLKMSNLSSILSEDIKPEFLVSISKLTTLKRLVLRNLEMRNRLQFLMCGFCQQNSDPIIGRDCCIAHCGSLKYLDVFGCYLGYNDLKFLEQLSYSKSLKYLDIGNNFLPVQRTTQTLLLFNSSLIVLHMSHCCNEYFQYNSETFPLSTFTQLRVLTLTGFTRRTESLKMLYSELQKINLYILNLDGQTLIGYPLYHLDILIKSVSEDYNILL